MITSLLSATNILGYVCSAGTLTSLSLRKMRPLRMLLFATSILWSIYGLIIMSPAVVITNVILTFITGYRLYEILSGKIDNEGNKVEAK